MPVIRPVRPGGFIVLGMILSLCSACNSSDGEDDGWYLEPSRAPVAMSNDPGDLMLELIDSLGAGVLSDGRGPLAISQSGLVAVAEYADCRVSVLDIVTHQLVYRSGSCGGGPSEFRGIGDVAFSGDSLYVYDVGRRDFSVLSPTGEIVRRFVAMAMVKDSVTEITSLSGVGDTLLGVGNSRPGRDPSAGALLRASDGSLVRKLGNSQRAVRDGRDIISFLTLMCSVNRPEGTLIFAVNPFRSETVAYTTSGEVAWRATPRIDWLSPVIHEQRTWPSAVVRPPICNDQAVMLRTMDARPWAPRGSSVGYGVIEVRAHDGRLLLSRPVDSTQSELFARAAGWKNYWVFNDPWSASPQLRVFRLRERTAANGTHIGRQFLATTSPEDR